jgi:hypothetical protein
MKHPGEYRRRLSRFPRDQERDFAPISRKEIIACLYGAPTSFSVRRIPKIHN